MVAEAVSVADRVTGMMRLDFAEAVNEPELPEAISAWADGRGAGASVSGGVSARRLPDD